MNVVSIYDSREQKEANSTNVTIERVQQGNDTKESLNLDLDDFGVSMRIFIFQQHSLNNYLINGDFLEYFSIHTKDLIVNVPLLIL